MKIKKVNKFKKASSKLAFLFACAIVFSPGVTSLQSCATTTEDIPCEISRPNNDNEITVVRSRKTMKQANRKNNDIVSYELSSIDTNLNTISLSYYVCSSNIALYSDTLTLFNVLNLTYDLNTNTFTSAEFEIEYSETNGEAYYLGYFSPLGFLQYLNAIDYESQGYINTYFDGSEIELFIYDEQIDNTYNFAEYPQIEGSYYGSVETFGNTFYIDTIINEVYTIKQLINAKYNDGLIVGEQNGYDDGYDNGYDYGYDEGYDDGFADGDTHGYDRGYRNGLELGENQGYSEGYSEGFSDGKGEGLMEGYQEGYNQAISDNAKDTGIFQFANIIVGLYNHNTNQFDNNYSSNDGTVEIEGGFVLNDFIYQFESDFTEGVIDEQDYSPGWVATFGDYGVSLETVEYLFPLDGQGSGYYPILTFGMEYQFNFTNGSIVYRGADDGAINQLKITDYMRSLGNLKSIRALGTSFDYVPYGITQNLSYSFGYDSGYQNGRSEGFDSGYDLGYTNGLNTTGSQKYIEGYNKGFLDAKTQYQNTEALSFEDVLTAVITAPNKIIREGFDFDILGINVGSFIQTCVVIGLIVFTIGLFKKG